MAAMLNRVGMDARTQLLAGSASESIAIWRPDAIVLPVDDSDGLGMRWLQEYRSNQDSRLIPILALSETANDDERNAVIAAGASAMHATRPTPSIFRVITRSPLESMSI